MAKRKKIRVVLDTNWYVSACINRKSRRKLFHFLMDERLQILYTDQLQVEFLNVISRPKFEKTVSIDQIQRFVRLVLPALEYIQLKSSVVLSRDPKDNYLLSLCKDGHANLLITGDQDLLVIKQFGLTNIISMTEFQQIMGTAE